MTEQEHRTDDILARLKRIQEHTTEEQFDAVLTALEALAGLPTIRPPQVKTGVRQ